MKILIGCEESQEVTKAFRKRGFEAYSCDLLDCSGGYPEWHLKMDVLKAIRGGHLQLQNGEFINISKWDGGFFFPDCTYITCSAEWAYKDGPYHQKVRPGTLVGKDRREAREKALQFICDIINGCNQRGFKWFGFENPVGVIPKRIFRYYDELTKTYLYRVFPRVLSNGGLDASQYIQPNQFGADASKKTGFWLFGLPTLLPTSQVPARIVNGRKRWGNQTDGGQNKLSPGSDRAKLRSKTFPGIAEAMAEQWGDYLLSK